ncbi:MAG: hypothetical protein JW746_08000 [Candidatus Krumholzibacteriota bacterium]|nr:hypothetical protein [Candidatus Krumholzibacteriota bacterium]
MFNKVKWFTVLMVVTAVFFVGCSEDTTKPVDSGSILRAYLDDNDLDLDNILTSWIIAAGDVYPDQADYYIMDLRAPEHFALGRIPGSVNTTLGTIVADAAANTDNDPILIVCYTGQSASHALVALRLSGYPDCKVLMFGFSSWSNDFDSWTANTSSFAVGDDNWTTDPVAVAGSYSYPSISATATTGAGILAERVAAMTAGGFKGVAASAVVTTPASYYINNYWDQTDVDTYGHIEGAYRIKPLTIAGDEFENLDPDETIVTYCWTGQTSSVITAYLTVLGYDAVSLKFGANGMIFSELLAHTWPGSATTYPVESD